MWRMFGVMPLGWIGNPAQQDIGATYMELVDYQQWLLRQLEKISGIFLKKYPLSVTKIASKCCNIATLILATLILLKISPIFDKNREK